MDCWEGCMSCHSETPPSRASAIIRRTEKLTSEKRTFEQISRSPPPQRTVTPPQPAWASHFRQAVQTNSTPPTLTSLPQPATHHQETQAPAARFQYDGFDFRRPIMSGQGGGEASSQPEPEVIDLTGDSPVQTRATARPRSHSPVRLEQWGDSEFRGLLDLEGFEELEMPPFEPTTFRSRDTSSTRRADTPAIDLTGPTPADLEDDEVQFVGSNVIRPSRDFQDRTRRLMRDRIRGSSTHEALQAARRDRPPHFNWDQIHEERRRPGLIDSISRLWHEPQLGSMERGRGFHDIFRRAGWPGSAVGFLPDMPLPDVQRDWTAGFNYTTGQPQRPTYQAPPAAPEGFTRSPGEDDRLVCPNCDHELVQGEELEKQVWVARECGHVRIASSSVLNLMLIYYRFTVASVRAHARLATRNLSTCLPRKRGRANSSYWISAWSTNAQRRLQGRDR